MPDQPDVARPSRAAPDAPDRLLRELVTPVAAEAEARFPARWRRLAARGRATSRWWVPALGSVALVASLAVASLTVRGGPPVPSGPPSGWTTHAADARPVRQGVPIVQLSTLTAGSCGVWDPVEASTGVGVVPCGEPHDFRVVGQVRVPPDQGTRFSQRQANEACKDTYPDEARAARDRDGIRAALPAVVARATEPAVCVVRV